MHGADKESRVRGREKIRNGMGVGTDEWEPISEGMRSSGNDRKLSETNGVSD